MRILGIIPARGGSKGVPGKNSKMLGEKPLISYTIEKAQESKLLTELIVSTDSQEIVTIAQKMGATIPFIRPEELATDSATSLEVVKHAVLFMENQGFFFDAVCLLQPTTPFREIGFIDKALEQFIASGADALVSVLPVPHEYNPHWVFETDQNGFLKIATGDATLITRRQELPKTFHRDGSVYVTKVSCIKSGSLYGEKIAFIESSPEFYVNIDTLEDWQNAQKKLSVLQNKI